MDLYDHSSGARICEEEDEKRSERRFKIKSREFAKTVEDTDVLKAVFELNEKYPLVYHEGGLIGMQISREYGGSVSVNKKVDRTLELYERRELVERGIVRSSIFGEVRDWTGYRVNPDRKQDIEELLQET